jgi:hypothetical protein
MWETVNKHHRPLSPHLTPILNPNSHPRLTTILLRLPLIIIMGGRSLSADFSPHFLVLTSEARATLRATGGFITGVIFAVTGAVTIGTRD